MKDRTFRDLYAEAEKSLAYQVEGAILEFTEELCRLMESQGVSRAELARRLDTSPAYVTKILRGTSNFTLETMVRAANALGHEVHLHMAPKGAMTRWFDQLPAVAISSVSSAAATTGTGEPGAKPSRLIEAA
jgi:transcriptional regulator with XRE-family HTH domain